MKNFKGFAIVFLLGLFVLGCTTQNDDFYERFYFRTSDGADLAIQVDGDQASGVFILLLHGGPGAGGGYTYNEGIYADRLESNYAVVYLDQRGQGASQGSYSIDEVNMQRFADDIYEVTLFLKQKYGQDISVFLMGHSWGGTTGTFALVNTELQNEIDGWIEVGGAHDIPKLYIDATKMFIEIGNSEINKGNNVEKWTEIVDFCLDLDTGNISLDEGGQLNEYGHAAEELIDEIDSPYGTGYSHGIATSPIFSLAAFMSSEKTANEINKESEFVALTNDLYKISIPTLLLWGKYDFVVPPSLGVDVLNKASTNDIELVIFDFSGHSPMSDEPDLFCLEIEDFIETYK